MKLTQSYREQLGLSQETLAMVFNISKSQLAMHETGKRDLPLAALEKLAAMTSFFKQETTSTTVELIKNQELQQQVFIEAQIKELEFQQIQAQRQLDIMLKKYNQNLALHAFALHLQAKGSSLREVLLQQVTKGIEKNGLVLQTQQTIKLEGIKAQLVYLKK
jgi:transcriptional regulator with XRE-family HTH domain